MSAAPLTSFVGIDQTGATVKGRPVPLRACVLHRLGGARWRLRPFKIETLNEQGLRSALLEQAGVRELPPVLAIDSVFGLPSESWPHRPTGASALWRLLRSSHELEGYGRATSEKFFARLLEKSGVVGLPRRPVEQLARCNSVFTTRPFQKNVQTGTYRIWKDLTSEGERWCRFWPFEAADSRSTGPWVLEAYPSWIWHELYGFRRRAPERFGELLAALPAKQSLRPAISRADLALLKRDGDFADAAVLALGAHALARAGKLFAPFTGFTRTPELRATGWIMGLSG